MFDSHGKFLRKWGSNGTATGEYRHPEGIGVDSRQGNVYVLIPITIESKCLMTMVSSLQRGVLLYR